MSDQIRTFITTIDASEHPPGSVFEWTHDYKCEWDNCTGTHVTVVLPTGDPFCPDQRASNCGRKDDRSHRCWVRSGPLDRLTLSKDGDTCPAGAGSIMSHASVLADGTVLCQAWHGFLRDGILTQA